MAYTISNLVREDSTEDNTHHYRASRSSDTRGIDRIIASFNVRLTKARTGTT